MIQYAFKKLTTRGQVRILISTGLQILIGCLDILGVLAIGAVGTLALTGTSSESNKSTNITPLNWLSSGENSYNQKLLTLSLLAIVSLLVKTFVSIILTRKTYFFLSNFGVEVTKDILGTFLAKDVTTIQSKSSQDILSAVTLGVRDLMMGVLATALSVIVDMSLLLLIFIGLLAIDPITATITIFYFSAIGFALHFLLQRRAGILSTNLYANAVKNNVTILEILSSFRELFVKNRQSAYIDRISSQRKVMASDAAEQMFMPYISKYVIEGASILGIVSLVAFQFLTNSMSQATGTIAIFIAASSRIAPAALRIQQGFLMIKASSGSAQATVNLELEIKTSPQTTLSDIDVPLADEPFVPSISLKSVYYSYPNSKSTVLRNINLEIKPGTFVALVGPTGSGKSTLIDLLLGVIDPSEGMIEISSNHPRLAIKKWPGAIAYLPQQSFVYEGTIKTNIQLGFTPAEVPKHLLDQALEISQLSKEIKKLPEGVETWIGPDGNRLSGGQNQRIGIARALLQDPKLLVLDEATSALDAQTEAALSQALKKFNEKGRTMIVVAHRLSSITSADLVVYINGGEIIATGTFPEVRRQIPDFDAQAKLMGIH